MTNTAAAVERRYATVTRRVAAYALDAVVVLLAYAFALVLGPATLAGILFTLLGVAYAVVMWIGVGLKGQTPAMRVIGLQVVDADSGATIGLLRALPRQLVLGLLGPVNIVQLFLIGNQERHQGWHDMVAHSIVIDTPATTAPAVAGPASTASTGTLPATRPSLATPVPPPIGPVPSAPSRGVIGPPPGVVLPPPPPPTAPPVPVPPREPSAETMVPPAATDREPASQTVISPRSPASQKPATATWKLVGASGERLLADLVLTGRDPDTSLVPGSAGWSLSDPELTVSKSHALFGVTDGSAWVEDWHSTNGVLLRRAGADVELSPHERAPLQEGDEVLLGDFVLKVEVVR